MSSLFFIYSVFINHSELAIKARLGEVVKCYCELLTLTGGNEGGISQLNRVIYYGVPFCR